MTQAIHVMSKREWHERRTWPVDARTSQTSGRYDIEVSCGYPTHPLFTDYWNLYTRFGLAARVVNIFPDECWAISPQVYETPGMEDTPFEKAWNALVAEDQLSDPTEKEPRNEMDRSVEYHLHKLDRLSGVGAFGVLLLGVDDGDANSGTDHLATPLRPAKDGEQRQLQFLKVYTEGRITITEWEQNPRSPRYGLPTMYQTVSAATSPGENVVGQIPSHRIHWTRVLHVAEGTLDSEVYGTPRLQGVLNTLLDMQKILGASAEMFWKGGFPGYVFVLDDEASPTAAQEAAMKEQIEAYYSGLDRYLTLQGVKPESLAVQVADPSKHLLAQLQNVAGAVGVPTRILIGSEAAKLASVEDRTSLNAQVRSRQTKYVEPRILRPFIDRLIWCGVLPRPQKIQVKWIDVELASEAERAEAARLRTVALTSYADSTARYVVMGPEAFLIDVMGYPKDQATAMAASALPEPPPVAPQAVPPTEPGGSAIP